MAGKLGNHPCITHSKAVQTDSDDHLISSQSYEAWLTLFEPAKICNFTPVLDVAENLENHEVLSIFYLSKCRSIFTINRDLETIKRKNQNPHNEEDEDFIQATTKRNATPPTRVSSKDCIFCERVKYIRSTSSREPLVKAAQLRVHQTLREKALAKCDQKILDVTSRDKHKRTTTDHVTQTIPDQKNLAQVLHLQLK